MTVCSAAIALQQLLDRYCSVCAFLRRFKRRGRPREGDVEGSGGKDREGREKDGWQLVTVYE